MNINELFEAGLGFCCRDSGQRSDNLTSLARGPQQVGIHHPASSFSDGGPPRPNLLDNLVQLACDERFIGQAELSAPVDGKIAEPVNQTAACKIAIEHDNYIAEGRGVLLEQPPSSG